MLAWDVSAEQEVPWQRVLQELSEARHEGEEYGESRRRLGIFAELVWLLPKPSGGGVAVVYLEADNLERALGESEAPFDSWYGKQMHTLFGLDLARLERVGSGELLFARRDDDVPGEHETLKDSAERERE